MNSYYLQGKWAWIETAAWWGFVIVIYSIYIYRYQKN